MALTDFFRINLPYGMKKNSKNEWSVFNREYVPLGLNSTYKHKSIFDENAYADFPLYTKYKGLTDNAILKIVKDADKIQRNEAGEIGRIFFYYDKTNPQSNPAYWNDYFEIIKAFSKFEKVSR
jgi:hypothetical protein